MASRRDFFKGTSLISRTLAFTDPARLPRDLVISATLAFCLTILLSRKIGLNPRHRHFFAFSPSSTRLRIASNQIVREVTLLVQWIP